MNSLVLVLGVCVMFTAAVSGQGIPYRLCPTGEHSVLYCPQKAEPSCDNPTVHNLVRNTGLCDVPQCFCNRPTVRNLKTGKCVKLEDCKK